MSAPPTIDLVNNFGETTQNYIVGGTNTVGTAPIADGTILGNISGGSELPAALTLLEVANVLPAKTGVTAISAIATADATDLASAEALANDCKAKINAILAALKVVS